MRIKFVTVIAVLLLFAIISSYSHAQQGSIRKEIQEIFDNAGVAFDSKDAEAVVEATALPGAILEYLDGTMMSIDEWRDRAANYFADIEVMQSMFLVERAEASEDTATAIYTETHNYIPRSDRPHRYRSMSRWSVTLTKTPEGWRATDFKELSEMTTRDGMPYTPEPTTPKF